MAMYAYEAEDKAGNVVRGYVRADSFGKACEAIMAKGYTVNWTKVTDGEGITEGETKEFTAVPAGPPQYSLVEIAGHVMIWGGCLLALYGLGVLLQGLISGGRGGEWRVGFVIMLSGIFAAGMGQLFHCVRDMARAAWRLCSLRLWN